MKEISDFSTVEVPELFNKLQSGPKGLSADVAKARIAEQKKFFQKETRFYRELKLFLQQFTNPLIAILLIVLFFSAVLKDTSDVVIILSIIFMTGVLGFIQELNAGRAAEKLLAMIKISHQVMRDGKSFTVSAPEIVPGDLLVLDAGDIIPADCRILESNELHVDESALTGESYPVEKAPGTLSHQDALARQYNCLWEGSHIVNGTALALVVNTASNTIFGKMERSVEKSSSTAFRQGVTKFSYFLLKTTVFLAIFIFVSNIYFGKSFFTSLLFSLALAVGMAPELLPAIMTFSMSVGSRRMSEKKVVVKKLSSIFNLGEVSVLCTDKTGTITEGALAIGGILDINGKSDDRIRTYAFLNSYFQRGFTNPIDQVISNLKIPLSGYEKLDEIPYDFIRKRLSVLVAQADSKILITKGAFANVLEVCSYARQSGRIETEPLSPELRRDLQLKFRDYSERGFRVLGIACKDIRRKKVVRGDEKGMVFLGFILLEDPLKKSTLSSIDRLKNLNISVKIVTGDNRFAALHIARQLGVENPQTITGKMLNRMSPEALVVRAAQTDVFSEIEPHQKERIITALQKGGLTVAYLGDGINDAAALHAADAGISTNNAVDVAKEASDFVLMEKDLSVIADGVYEGRKSFVNSMKYIYATTGSTFGNMITVAAASLFLPFLPMLPKQILVTNLISDFPYLTVASDRVDQEEIGKPLTWNIKQIRQFMLVFGIHSSIFDFITFYVLFFRFHLFGSPFQTGWFLESILTELVIILIVRTKRHTLKSVPSRLLLGATVSAFLFTVWLPFSPLNDALALSLAHPLQLPSLFFIVILYALTAEWVKILFFRHASNVERKRELVYDKYRRLQFEAIKNSAPHDPV